MDTEYIREGLEFALQILDELDEETCRNYYFEEYKFDKESPADEIENVICLALKSKLGINESLNEDKEDIPSDLIAEDENWKVYSPSSYESSCKLGDGTRWCTAWTTTDHYYKYYTQNGKELVIFINKNNPEEKYQLEPYGRLLFCDSDDRIPKDGFKKFAEDNLSKDVIDTLIKRYPDLIIKTESLNKKSLKESDKPAATSIEDAQKWVDYDMKRYKKISNKTNDLIKKAGFQIIKDDHGDYEVTAGYFE